MRFVTIVLVALSQFLLFRLAIRALELQALAHVDLMDDLADYVDGCDCDEDDEGGAVIIEFELADDDDEGVPALDGDGNRAAYDDHLYGY